MSCECESVSKNKNPSVVEVKEEWSRGLELVTLLETSSLEFWSCTLWESSLRSCSLVAFSSKVLCPAPFLLTILLLLQRLMDFHFWIHFHIRSSSNLFIFHVNFISQFRYIFLPTLCFLLNKDWDDIWPSQPPSSRTGFLPNTFYCIIVSFNNPSI